MSTRIFNVEFWYREARRFGGETISDNYKTNKNVVAENARDAVNKIENIMKTDPEYNYEWELEEPPYGTFKTTFINFDPINVTLEAEAD